MLKSYCKIAWRNLIREKQVSLLNLIGLSSGLACAFLIFLCKERKALAGIAAFYKSYNLGLDFEYKFMDETYRRLYASEERVAILSRYFAAIAIIISCLGLFGLTAYIAMKRQKEIGIRKIVGATVGNITALLSADFLKLVVLAILIAFPVAGWLMNNWLKDFAYRVNIDITVYLLAGLAIFFITLFTISFQSIKAAMANPVKSLRAD